MFPALSNATIKKEYFVPTLLSLVLIKPGLHIVVTIAELASDVAIKRILRL